MESSIKSENIGVKKRKFGIKFPNGEVENVVFLSPSSSGLVFGVTHSNRHIQLVFEESAISSHATLQGEDKRDHVGRLFKSDIDEKLWLDVLKPRKMLNSELDKKVFYLTKRWDYFFNTLEDNFLKKEETKREIISYLDLDILFKHSFSFFQQVSSSPEKFWGQSAAKEILSCEGIECGLLEDKRAIIKIEDELYGIDLSSIQTISPLSNIPSIDNPLSKILKNLGIMSLSEDLMNRLKEISQNKQNMS